jgi:hypothetical protein
MFLLTRSLSSAPFGQPKADLIGVDAKALHEGIQEQLLLKWRLPDITESLATSFERVDFASLAQWERLAKAQQRRSGSRQHSSTAFRIPR